MKYSKKNRYHHWNRLRKSSQWVTLILIVALIAGCGSSGDGEGATGDGTIHFTLNFDGVEVPAKGNEVEQAITKYTGNKVDFTFISSNDYCTKLPVMIASGELSEVIASCGAPNQSYLISAAQGGTFWDLTDIIKDYPKLSSMSQIVYDNVSIDGKLYGIPRSRPIARYTNMYREDWAEKLSIAPPTTMDDMYNMLKAFTDNDPDGNGQKDTYGLSAMINNTAFSPDFGIAFGAPNNWEENNGTFTKAEETDAYLEGLKFTKKLYDEGILNRDFASIDRGKFEGELENGKAGMINGTTNNVLSYQARLEAQNKNGKLDFFSVLDGPAGKKVGADRGSNGILMFPKASVQSEQQLRTILTFFEKMTDKEMADLLEWGIEGKHYEIKNGKAVRTNQDAYDNEVGFPYNKPLVTIPLTDIKTPGDLDPISAKALKIEKENEQYLVNDPTMTLISDTWSLQGAELLQILNDAKVKFVMGKIDENGWHQAVEQYKKAGGDQVAKEYAEALAAQPAK